MPGARRSLVSHETVEDGFSERLQRHAMDVRLPDARHHRPTKRPAGALLVRRRMPPRARHVGCAHPRRQAEPRQELPRPFEDIYRRYPYMYGGGQLDHHADRDRFTVEEALEASVRFQGMADRMAEVQKG